jgi:Rod binding domain-containing protein
MNIDLSTASFSPILASDNLSNTAGMSQEQRIKVVSKAMEGVFTSQLMAEMGKSLGGPLESKDGDMYQDFIQQAMTRQVTSGGGFGLAKVIETYLTPAAQHHAATPLSTHAPSSNAR